MLLILTFLATIVIYAVSKIYVGDDRRLPPASTPKGKEARLVLGMALVPAVIVMVMNLIEKSKQGELTVTWIVVSAIIAGVLIFRYIQFKRKKQ